MKIRKLKNYMKAFLVGVSFTLVGCGSKNVDEAPSFGKVMEETSVSLDEKMADKEIVFDEWFMDEKSDSVVDNNALDEECEYLTSDIAVIGYFDPSVGKEVFSVMKRCNSEYSDMTMSSKSFKNMFKEENQVYLPINNERINCTYGIQYYKGVFDENSVLCGSSYDYDLSNGVSASSCLNVINIGDSRYIFNYELIYNDSESFPIVNEFLSTVLSSDGAYCGDESWRIFMPVTSFMELGKTVTKDELRDLQDKLDNVDRWQNYFPNSEDYLKSDYTYIKK